MDVIYFLYVYYFSYLRISYIAWLLKVGIAIHYKHYSKVQCLHNQPFTNSTAMLLYLLMIIAYRLLSYYCSFMGLLTYF